ncbi:MAG: transglutaminase family protein, partial [Candidatus Bathyarchaeia archaeon]
MRIGPLRKTAAVALTLFVLLASSTSNSFTLVKGEILDVDYVIQTTVTFSNNGTNVWNLTEEDREISLFMNNTWQTVFLTESSYPIEKTETDEDGNWIAILELPGKLEPGSNVNYTVTYNVESKQRVIPHLNKQESGNLTDRRIQTLRGNYCRGGDAWQIDDPTLQETAHAIAGNETNVLSVVEKFVAWIWSNISYGSSEVPRYPNETLLSREGDCDDQAILFITLCRIYGIPSYLQVGCIYEYGPPTQQSNWNGTVTSVLRNIAWHGWAMVYVPPWGWLPVDFTYVMGGQGIPVNPLNAIKRGAVTSRRTIQYMNISQRDYVASSRNYRDFLIENQIYIHQKDEMSQTPQKSWEQLIERWIQWFQWSLITVGII